MRKIIFLSALFCCLLINNLQAQKKRIILKGTVTEKKTNLVMPGVSIVSGKPSRVVGISDDHGHFEVNVEEEATLTFTYVSFKPSVIKLKPGQVTLDVFMNENKSY